ncbi:MAG: hypothetical protein RL281_1085 [Pseudomonadota bacterium]
MGGTWQSDLKLLADGVDLSLDGVAGDGPSGPTFGHHGAKPNSLRVKERGMRIFNLRVDCSCARVRQAETMQCEMWGARNRATCEGSLELRAGF